MKSPSEAAAKWARNTAASGPEFEAGVRRVNVAPSTKAVAAQDKMRQNILLSIDSGRWAAGLNSYSLQSWQNDMINKGKARIASGAQQAEGKVLNAYNKLFPEIERISNMVNAMPKNNIEDSIARMTTQVREMSKLKGITKR